MPSSSPERGRTRSRQQTSAFAKSQTPSRTRSPPRRTISPRSKSRSKSPTRSPSARGNKSNGYRNGRDRSRSPTRTVSRSRSRDQAGKRYRERSYTRSRSRGSPVLKSSKIVVEKLTKNVNEGHLQEIFGAYGPIRELELPMNRQFMTNRGTAYIVYTDTPDAEAAIAHMHEAQLDGAIINVSIVLPRRKFSRSPPPPRRGAPYDRFEARGPPPGGYRGGPPPPMDRFGRDGPPGGDLALRRGEAKDTGVETARPHRGEEEEEVQATLASLATATEAEVGVEVGMAVEDDEKTDGSYEITL